MIASRLAISVRLVGSALSQLCSTHFCKVIMSPYDEEFRPAKYLRHEVIPTGQALSVIDK